MGQRVLVFWWSRASRMLGHLRDRVVESRFQLVHSCPMSSGLLFLCVAGAALAACATTQAAPQSVVSDASNSLSDGGVHFTDANPDASVLLKEDAASFAPDSADADAGPVFAKIACGTPLPGVPLVPDLVEAQAGFEAELMRMSVSKVPDPYVYSAESRSVQGLINDMLDCKNAAQLAHADAKTGMGRSVLAAAARGSSAGRLDLAFLRRGLHHFDVCEQALPAGLEELVHRYGRYDTWESETIECAPQRRSAPDSAQPGQRHSSRRNAGWDNGPRDRSVVRELACG